MNKNRLCELLGIEYPIIQAPMNWITDAVLASAVSNAGGLGIIGPNAGAKEETEDIFETGERLRQQIRMIKSLTKKPFGVNFSCASPYLRPGDKPFSDRCVDIAIDEGIYIAVLTGDTPELYTDKFKKAGIKVLYRALPVNVEIAKKAEKIGIDAFIAVGFEGGGHTGPNRIPTFILIPTIVDAIQIPVIAGGGIGDGRGMAAALALGAEGVFMGTAFIVANECPAHENVKQAIIDACDTSTTTIDGAGGIVLRLLNSSIVQQCIKMKESGCTIEEITKVYRSGYRKGMLEGDLDKGTFVFGMSSAMIKEKRKVEEIIQNIIKETEQILKTFPNNYLEYK